MDDEEFQNLNDSFFDYLRTNLDLGMRTPEFLQCGFEKALRDTLANHLEASKPFLIYLNDKNSKNHEIFFMQNICNDLVCDYLLNESWPIWPVDVTDKKDKNALYEILNKRLNANLSSIHSTLPMMIMFSREGMEIYVGAIMCSEDPMTIVGQLYDAGGAFNADKDMKIQVARSKRDQRAFSKMQKEIELQKEKEENEKREAALAEEMKIKQEQQLKETLKLNRDTQIEFARSQITDVPPSANNFMFRFRMPTGEVVNRQFSDSQTINDVFYFVESLGHLRSEVKILYSYPMKDMCAVSDEKMSLSQIGASKRESMNVQKKQ